MGGDSNAMILSVVTNRLQQTARGRKVRKRQMEMEREKMIRDKKGETDRGGGGDHMVNTAVCTAANEA